MQQESTPKWRTRIGHQLAHTGNSAGLRIKNTGNAAGLKIKSAGVKLMNTREMALSKIKNTVAPYTPKYAPNRGKPPLSAMQGRCTAMMQDRLRDKDDNKDELECSVCTEPLTVATAVCVCSHGHWLCRSCYLKIVNDPAQHTLCPMCRNPMCHSNNRACSTALTTDQSGLPHDWWHKLPKTPRMAHV